jgi:hypothetical protein
MSPLIPLTIEVVGLCLCLLAARYTSLGASSLVKKGWRSVAAIGRHHVVSVALVGILSLAISISLSLMVMPAPKIHDEFSYLLAADTFASGRVTSPTHPLWPHFESFHIIHQPTYMSKYPPGNGLLLALGQFVFGHPIVGVWLGTALAAASICWMLQGCVPGKWALLGALMVAFHPKIAVNWGQNYWGGSLAMIGGALLFGACIRLVKRQRASDAVAMAVGVVVLANTRPFEGFVVSSLVALGLIVWLFSRRGPSWRQTMTKIALPGGAILAAAAAAMGYYDLKVTGDPLTLPYQIHEGQYNHIPLFLWQQPREVPEYRHEQMRRFYTGYSADWYHTQRTLSGIAKTKLGILIAFGVLFVRMSLAPALIVFPRTWHRPTARWATVILVTSVFVSCLGTYLQPHYLAPVLPLLILLLILGLRVLYTGRRSRPRNGRILVSGLLLVNLLVFGVEVANHLTKPKREWHWERQSIARQLHEVPGNHLVFVHYSPTHDVHQEWVYNAADIDSAKVVWAREMSPDQDRSLVAYFANRRIWRLLADESPPRLERAAFDLEGTK